MARWSSYAASTTPTTKGGNAPDGRKVKATLHWVSAAESIVGEVRLYNTLFTRPDPGAGAGGDVFVDLNPDSLEILPGCRLEPSLATRNAADAVQFERQGYFCMDTNSAAGRLVFNRTVGLRDSWAKQQTGGA